MADFNLRGINMMG